MLFRLAFRSERSPAISQLVRQCSNFRPPPLSLGEHKPTLEVKISRLIIALSVPLLAVVGYQTYQVEKEHDNHPRPPYIDYDHLYAHRKVKPLPYGDGLRTPFHNPARNPLPGIGYEVEDPYVLKMKAQGGEAQSK